MFDFGNSYLMVWGGTRYKVQHVGGISTLPLSDPRAVPIKASRIALKPTTKILFGDWPWFPDRDIYDGPSAWHNDRGKAFFPVIFGDGHVENFKFPANYKSLDQMPPDINFTWW